MDSNPRHAWAKGVHRPRGVTADAAAAELERIRAERGALTAQSVVDESRDPGALLHPAFEWDDAKAAEEYRRRQASSLIRAVVTVKTEDQPEYRTFVLVRAPEDEEADTSYLPAAEVVRDVDLLGDAIARLRSEVVSAQRSVNEVVSLASAVNAPDERRRKLRSVSDALGVAGAAAAEL